MSAATGTRNKVCDKFKDPEADVVVVSSDGVKFRLHSRELRSMSSVFDHMLGDANSIATEVPLAEDAKALEASFKFAFLPIGSPSEAFQNMADARNILDFCRKYDAPRPLSLLRYVLYARVNSHPVRTFILACELGAEDLCQVALRQPGFCMLRYPDLNDEFSSSVTAAGLHALHVACWKACDALGWHLPAPDWIQVSSHFHLPDSKLVKRK